MNKLFINFISSKPYIFKYIFECSVIKKAINLDLLKVSMIKKINFFKKNNNLKDSASCGDGPGQILKINYIVRTINALLRKFKYKYRSNNRVILLDSTGDLFDQKRAEKLLEFNNIMFVCGRYEGIDVRVNKYVDESFSIGNYIITGGENYLL